jgi:hypothetical protein
MSYPSWNLSSSASNSGQCYHVGDTDWSISQSDAFSLNYIDATNTVQTIWFRNLSNLLRSSPVVYLHVQSNQGPQPNNATYIITGMAQNNTIYNIGVRYQSSSQEMIGDMGANLSFNYYSSIN